MTDNAKQAIDDLMKFYGWCIDRENPECPIEFDDLATLCLVAVDLITSYSIAAEKASAKAALCDEAIAAGAKAQKEAEQMKASRDYWQRKAIAAGDRLQAIQEAEDEFMLCYGY